MSEEEPKDRLGFHIKFKIGKEEYEINDEGKDAFTNTIEEIGILVEQGKQKKADKDMEKRVLKKEMTK